MVGGRGFFQIKFANFLSNALIQMQYMFRKLRVYFLIKSYLEIFSMCRGDSRSKL